MTTLASGIHFPTGLAAPMIVDLRALCKARPLQNLTRLVGKLRSQTVCTSVLQESSVMWEDKLAQADECIACLERSMVWNTDGGVAGSILRKMNATSWDRHHAPGESMTEAMVWPWDARFVSVCLQG